MQKFEGKNKKESFSELLKAQILSGKLKSGERLPPEREMAQEYGISRGSVNQAILDLERAGFICVVPRKGTFVAEYMKNATPETLSAIMSLNNEQLDSRLFTDLMNMRILVECECARLACKNRESDIITKLHERIEALFSSKEDQLVEAIFLFHRHVVRASGNYAYSMIFTSFEKLLRSLISAHYSDTYEIRRNLPLFSQLASAIIMGDEDKAYHTMHEILTGALNYMNSYLTAREEAHVKEK